MESYQASPDLSKFFDKLLDIKKNLRRLVNEIEDLHVNATNIYNRLDDIFKIYEEQEEKK